MDGVEDVVVEVVVAAEGVVTTSGKKSARCTVVSAGKKKKTDLQVANEIDEKPKVGLVDVSVKLPSQFRKDEIFELSMSKSNIETIVKLVSKLQQIADEHYIDHEEEKLNIAENSSDKIQPTGPPVPLPHTQIHTTNSCTRDCA